MRYSLSVAGEERTAAQHYQKLLDRLYPALSRLGEPPTSNWTRN